MAGPFSARLASRQVVAPAVVDYVFEMVEPARLTFLAGQFVSIGVPGGVEGATVRRSYSIASRSDRGDKLRFIIKLVEGPASAFFETLEPGAPVEMTGPHGFFVLDREHLGDVVFAATGTGIAP